MHCDISSFLYDEWFDLPIELIPGVIDFVQFKPIELHHNCHIMHIGGDLILEHNNIRDITTNATCPCEADGFNVYMYDDILGMPTCQYKIESYSLQEGQTFTDIASPVKYHDIGRLESSQITRNKPFHGITVKSDDCRSWQISYMVNDHHMTIECISQIHCDYCSLFFTGAIVTIGSRSFVINDERLYSRYYLSDGTGVIRYMT